MHQVMTLWRRAALAGFIAGMLVALIVLTVVRVAVNGGYANLWARTVSLSIFIFPTHIFLAPLSGGVSFSTALPFYSAAVIGNGVVYSLAVQIVAAVYFIAKRVFGHFV